MVLTIEKINVTMPSKVLVLSMSFTHGPKSQGSIMSILKVLYVNRLLK